MLLHLDLRNRLFVIAFGIAALAALSFLYFLAPVAAGKTAPSAAYFFVEQGEGFREVAQRLYDTKLIRSRRVFTVLALARGETTSVSPGWYALSPSMSSGKILNVISGAERKEVEVTIPEGSSLYAVDRILSSAEVIPPKSFVTRRDELEGMLFPDTYRFFTNAPIEETIEKFVGNFNARALPLLSEDPLRRSEELILASILEREVVSLKDRRLVAGIINKRLASGVPIQIDATVCYTKEVKALGTPLGCYPITRLDLAIDFPYNTYLYKGLPPGPIGNPGISAIQAAQSPLLSPYWYYLSDPKTGETIFSETLDAHNTERALYLR